MLIASVEIVIPIVLFTFIYAAIVSIAKLRHQRKMKELELAAAQRSLPAAATSDSALEQRVRHLEAIVSSVDFELNAKLDRLASRHLAALQAPAASPPPNLTPNPFAAQGLPGNTQPDPLALANTAPFGGASLTSGKRLANRFVIERLLGRGGMGEVYLARDEQLGEQVALKLIGGMAALDPQAAERFRREASASRKVSHPNVVRLHDIGEADGVLFLSMEYVPGPSLRELLARHGVIPTAQLRGFARQMSEGLQAAHGVGIVHRDLKPGNVIVDPNQGVKIIDFGLARMAYLEGMTATNTVVGTVEYMAPEQIRGGVVDARTDIYALGAVLFHSLVGRPPFSGENPIAVGFAHCSQPTPVPSALRPELGTGWDRVIVQAMAKDPAQRWQSALELRDALPPL